MRAIERKQKTDPRTSVIIYPLFSTSNISNEYVLSYSHVLIALSALIKTFAFHTNSCSNN